MYPFLRSYSYFGAMVPGIFSTPGGSSCSLTEGDTLTSDTLRTGSAYGDGIKQVGNELFVGEPGAVGSIFSVGEVHYYTRSGSADPWTRQSGFFSPTQGNGAEFGSDIDYDGTRVIVGEPNVSKNADIFTFAGGVATPEQSIAANTYTNSSSRFGRGVAIKGLHCLIGAPGQDITETDQGGVEYWENIAGTWTFRQAFTMNGTPAATAYFGSAVTMTDDSTAYISWATSGTIVIEKWTRSGTTWSYSDNIQLIGYSAASFMQLDSDGTNLILGFPSYDNGGLGSDNYGAAIVLTQAGNILEEIVGSTLTQQLGSGVTISSNEIVVGNRGADPSGVSNAGTATVYNICL